MPSGKIYSRSAAPRQQTHGERQSAFIRLLHDVTATANAPLPQDQALRQGLEEIAQHTGWPVAHLYLADPGVPAELVSCAIWPSAVPEQFPLFQAVTEAMRFVSGVGLVGQVQATVRPVWVNDVRHEPQFIRGQGVADLGVRAGALFPVLVGEEVAGVLECFASEAAEVDLPQLNVLANVGVILGRIVERGRAHERLRQQEAARRLAAEAIVIELAHEINNPLYAARSALALLADELASTETSSPYLDVARAELARLANVMQRLRYSVSSPDA